MSENKRHKFADVIIAWAEGKHVQFLHNGNWIDFPDWRYTRTFGAYSVTTEVALGDKDFEWRIKPEKKTGWINIYDGYISTIYQSKAEALCRRNKESKATIKIEYEEGQGL